MTGGRDAEHAPIDAAARWDARYARTPDAGAGRMSDLGGIVPNLALPEQPRRAVDVGCGTGEDARWLARAGFETVGVDLSATALRIARERTQPGTSVAWRVGDVTALPAEDASCVLVTDRGCLHHVASRDLPAYVSEVARVLAPGGAWLIRDMVGHDRHHRDVDPEGIRNLAHESPLRFEACDVTEVPHARHGAVQMMVAVLRRA